MSSSDGKKMQDENNKASRFLFAGLAKKSNKMLVCCEIKRRIIGLSEQHPSWIKRANYKTSFFADHFY